jgi:BirA family transcriptional regulator, biotin operon repressor / biotin---[acetyl-CoA-carboxylase] ligase
MSPSADLTFDGIQTTLATTRLGQRLTIHQALPSTNGEAMLLAQAGAPHGTVVVAESQTAGRGRQGRSWFSPEGMNVYASVLIRPGSLTIPLADWLGWIPLTTAIAAAESIQQLTGLPPSLKWPNDLLIDHRKVGGILCESGTDPEKHPFVVIGLGLNVNTPLSLFPPELTGIATSLLEETHRPVDRSRLLAQFLLDLEQALDELASEGPRRLHHAYTTRCATLGKRVRVVVSETREWIGQAESIGLDGALHVRPAETSVPPRGSQIVEVRAADVMHLRE